MRRITVSVLLFFIVIASANAVCEYLPDMEISDIGLTTIYPDAGINEHVWFSVDSNEMYNGELRIFLQKNGVEFVLINDEVYISRGINKFEYDFKVNELLEPGMYLLHINIGNYDYTVPIIVANDEESVSFETSSRELYDGTYETMLRALVNGTARATYEIRNGFANVDYASFDANPENGSISVSKACNNCRIKLQIAYRNLIAQIDKTYGTYSEPYIKILEFNKDGISFETCAPSKYNVYINGKLIGDKNGVGRIDVPLSSGYEDLEVMFVSANKGAFFDRTISLSKFSGKNVSINVEITKNSPFSIKITAKDEFGRYVHSQGLLKIHDEDGNEYVNLISFDGVYTKQENLKNGDYVVEYEGVTAKGSARAVTFEEEERKVEREIVGSDITPVIAAMLALGLVVLIIIWIKRKV